MTLSLETAISICRKIESGETALRAIPYEDPQTEYLISTLTDFCVPAWADCAAIGHPGWLSYTPELSNGYWLYLKCKASGTVYFISN